VHAEEEVRDAERARDLPGILDRLGPAAAPEALRRLLRLARPDAHGDADDVRALLDEQRRGDRRVDASAHADDDAFCHLLSASASRQAARTGARARPASRS